jgi:ATP-dependent RNA helicase RhlE
MFFSATLEGEAGRIAREYTRDAVRHEHSPTPRRTAAVEHRFISVERADRVDALMDELSVECDRALVFVRTKRGADRLAKQLRSNGLAADAMHGDKSQVQRERTLFNFERGRVNVLVATDVAARGIHVEGISHVINFDPPEDRDGYVHRIGRTARAGETGVGITFVGAEQAHDVAQIAGQLRLHAAFERSGLGSRRASSGTHRKPTVAHGRRRRNRRAPRRST